MSIVYIVLPTYNEEGNIAPLLEKIRTSLQGRVVYKLVIVDDGSTDHTPDLLKTRQSIHPMTVLRHSPNKGLGQSIRTAFTHLSPLLVHDDFVVTMDADNTQDPSLIPRMLQLSHEGNIDVVIASRFRTGAAEIGVPTYRRILSRLAGGLMRCLFPIPNVRDYTSGYRLYKATAIQSVMARFGDSWLESTGFSCMAELLIKLSLLSPALKFSEIALILRYNLKVGQSKIKVIWTVFRYFQMSYQLKKLSVYNKGKKEISS
ncbi:MAG TPA: glycosyltransferase family 2 protein [Elusimicrobiota bacterium]|nr:glycosyltransferase family 2 protein [Elusimicrobiota bacterium]